MNRQEYLFLRNYLQSIVIFVNVWSKEYANLNKRIRYCHDKAYAINR